MGQAAGDLTNNRTGWRMVVVVFFVMALVYTIWYSFAVFLPVLVQDFGWGRGEAALGFSIFTLFGAVFSPLLGSLLDRFGSRAVMVVGAVLTAAGLAASSQIQELWQFYLFFGVLVAIGSSACGWMPCVAVIQSWFSRNFSTANGLANSGIGIGIFIFVPGIQLVINNFGWRTTYLIMAVVALVVVTPLCFLLDKRPQETVPVTTPAPAAATPAPAVSWTFRHALRSPALWFLFGMAVLLNFSNQQPLVHQIAYLTDQGIQAVLAATIAGTMGLVSAFAKPAWGFAADKIGREVSVTIGGLFVIASLAALWWLPGRGAPELLFIYAALIGIGYSISNPLPPAMTADLFPGRHFGSIFGVVVMGTFGGSAVGAWLAGYLFDQTGSYLLPFIIAAVGTCLAIICAWLAAPRRARAAAVRLAAAQAASPGGERLSQALPFVPDQQPASRTVAAGPAAGVPAVAGGRPVATRAEGQGRAKAEGPLDGTERTVPDLLAADVAAERYLAGWAAWTPDAELAEVLEVAAARARDRAFQLRRAGVATPAGAQSVPERAPESGDDVARLDRWLERPALYGEGSAAERDPALHAILPALQASEAETWSLLAEQRERLTAERHTAAVQVLPATAARTAENGVVWQTISEGGQSLSVTRISQRPGATVRLCAPNTVALLPLTGQGFCRPARTEAIPLRVGRFVEIATSAPVEIVATGDWPLTYLALGAVELAAEPVAPAPA